MTNITIEFKVRNSKAEFSFPEIWRFRTRHWRQVVGCLLGYKEYNEYQNWHICYFLGPKDKAQKMRSAGAEVARCWAAVRRYLTSKAENNKQDGRKGKIILRIKHPILARDAQIAQRNLVHTRTQRLRDWGRTVFMFPVGGTGCNGLLQGQKFPQQSWGCKEALLEEVIINHTTEPPELTLTGETDSEGSNRTLFTGLRRKEHWPKFTSECPESDGVLGQQWPDAG